jgi:hypothetical protein
VGVSLPSDIIIEEDLRNERRSCGTATLTITCGNLTQDEKSLGGTPGNFDGESLH